MQRNVTQCTVNVSANPPETYRFCLFFVFYSVVCLFLPSKTTSILHSFEDFGCLSVMSYDASCVDTMKILMVFAAFSTTVLGSQQGLSIQTLTECARRCGQMSILSFKFVFTMFFSPCCAT